MDIGLMVLRLVLGTTFALHGAQKLLGWFDGPGLRATGAVFESMGFRGGTRTAFFAGITELGAGVLLVIGLLTPAAAAAFFAVMLVAGVSVHLPNGFFAQNGGYEYNLVLALAALTLAFTGPGAISIDHWMGLGLEGTEWGLGALLVGLVGGAGQLAMRRTPRSSAG